MGAAFRSEWTKLRRRSLLASTYAALAVVSGLLTVLTFARAGKVGRNGRELISLAQLASTDGLARSLARGTGLMGVVALAVVAAQMAGEYSHGTLRNLLVRQPRRPVLLVGKYLALLTFVLGAGVVAVVVSGGAAFAMAHTRDISTVAWTSSDGWHQSLDAVLDSLAAIVGYATFGMVLGTVVRSPVASAVVGIVYLLPFEGIVVALIDTSDRWLPGQLLDAVAHGGTSTVSFAAALATTGAYLVVAAVAAGTLFARRDVTA